MPDAYTGAPSAYVSSRLRRAALAPIRAIAALHGFDARHARGDPFDARRLRRYGTLASPPRRECDCSLRTPDYFISINTSSIKGIW